MSGKTKIQGGIGQEHYVTKLSMRGHLLVADEPLENGGKDAGPTPNELIMSGLAACTASTLRMYADKKGWEVDRIDVEITINIEKKENGQVSHINNIIEITGNLTQEQRERMLEIAHKCPAHKLLTNPITIHADLKSAL